MAGCIPIMKALREGLTANRIEWIAGIINATSNSIRFAVNPSRNAFIIGIPPATAASKATITPLLCAAAKISVPCEASTEARLC